MKKKVLSIILSVLIIFTFSISNIPLNELNTVHAEKNIATNFIDFLRTNLGLAKVNNGSLSNVSRDDFAQSLYNTPLVWTDNGVNFSFTPSDEFSKSQWNQMCIYGGSDDTRFVDFDLKECLIKSDYIDDDGSGLNISNFPKLSDTTNTTSPLDGIEVKTNFSDFDPKYSETLRPSYNENFVTSLKDEFLSNYDNVIIFAGYENVQNFPRVVYQFVSFDDTVEFYSFVVPSGYGHNNMSAYYRTNEWVNNYNTSNTYLTRPTNASTTQKNSYYGLNFNAPNLNYIQYSNLNFVDPAITQEYGSRCGFDETYGRFKNNTVTCWSNKPVVIGSNTTAIQNYYYWINGTPQGSFYTTANTNTIYNYDYINNNNWESAYNNYITDVSNYYSTTENITNEQLTNYIDQSTTITNITNNYITNNQGGSGEDDIITNSWLERIFNKLNEIKDILLGKNISDSDDDIPNLTDDSIKNDLLRFPAENLFPDLNDEDIITPEDIIENDNKIPWDLITSKMGSVISDVVPFCYIFQIKSLFLALSAPPQDPYFVIPFFIERLGIDENVTIDLTAQAWDNLHTIWITLFLIIFLAFLFYLTHKILMLISNMFV